MTDFKKGDVVTHRLPERFPGTYTVTQVNTYTVDTTGDGDGRSWVFSPDYLTRVTPEPYVPQVGDKVRVTIEDVVADTDGTGDFRFSDGVRWVEPGKDFVRSVELIKKAPLPYPVGTVAVDSKSNTYEPMARTAEGAWLNLGAGGQETVYSDHGIRSLVDKGILVTHEPPTS